MSNKKTDALPTLYRRGYLINQEWYTDYEKNMSGIEYMIKYLNSIDTIKNKYQPNGPGDKVILLRAGTGSGKSTSIPPEIFYKVIDKKQNIICGEPTSIVTKEKVYDILKMKTSSLFQNFELGNNIGYLTGADKKRIRNKGILYATHGVIRQQLLSMNIDSLMRIYRYIIIDELHVRTIEVEQILTTLKQIIEKNWKNPLCPYLLCMSATFEPKEFMNFFSIPKKNFIDVKGDQNYEIKEIYPKYEITNIINYIFDTIIHIHLNNIDDVNEEYKNIIVFGPSSGFLKKISFLINKFNAETLSKKFSEVASIMNVKKKYKVDDSKKYYLSAIILTSATYSEGEIDYKKFLIDVNRITEKIKIGNKIEYVHPSRKIILATPVAETGVTFHSLKYCIDSGLVNEVTYLNDIQCRFISVKDITKFSLTQRKGRIGRTYPGEWYPCYTKELESKLMVQNMPSIVTAQLHSFIMSEIIKQSFAIIESANESEINQHNINNGVIFKKYKNIDNSWYKINYKDTIDISKIDLITTPPYSYFMNTFDILLMYGFINYNYEPTIYGMISKNLPKIDIFQLKMILSGYHYNVDISNLILISIVISFGNIFDNTYKKRNPLKLPLQESLFYNRFIIMDDFVEIIFVFDEINELIEEITNNIKDLSSFIGKINIIRVLTDWCKKNGLRYKEIIKVLLLKEEIIEAFVKQGMNPYFNKNKSLTKILNSDISAGLKEIKNYKHCFYEGYKYFLCINKDNKYYMINNNMLEIKIYSELCSPIIIDGIQQAQPKYVVSYCPILSAKDIDDEKTVDNMISYYTINTSIVSVLDCYVNVDLSFNKN